MTTSRDRVPAFGAALLVALVGLVAAYGMVPGSPLIPSELACESIGPPLEVSVSTEKASGDPARPKALDTIAAHYNQGKRRVVANGRTFCAEVHVTAQTSGSAEKALEGGWTQQQYTQGAAKPEVWLPSSSVWPQLLAERSPVEQPRTTIDSLAQSPLVLGLPMRKALALQAHLNGRFDWSLLQKLVDSRNVPLAWGDGVLAGGDPQWGRFHLRKDDPIASTSGLAAVVTAYLDLHRSYPTWRIGDDTMKRAFRRLEGLVSEGGYTADGTEMMRQLANLDVDDPGWGDDTSAVVVQEALLYQYNMHALAGGAPTTDPRELLVPFYSANAPPGMDHPFVELAGLDATPARLAVAKDFARFLENDARARDEFSAAGLRDLKGKALPGLVELDRKLQRQQGAPQRRMVAETARAGAWPYATVVKQIQDLWQQTRKRAHILVLVDESLSMVEDKRMAQAKASLRSVLQEWTTPNDQIALWGFSAPKGEPAAAVTRPLLTGWQPGGASKALEYAITRLKPRADTPLFRAIKLAREEVAEQPSVDESGEWANVVVVLTDGDDDFVDEPASIAWADDNDVPVYSVAFGSKAKDAVANLREIARRTHGGYQDATNPQALDKAFAAMVRVA